MSIVNVVALLGGMALFLYGITLMGDGLNKVAGNRLQVVLYRLTSNPLKGILLGIGVTALIQSSSATSIMAIGFVNSGMMEFAQAASIVLGSVLGTSITGWIVYSFFSPTSPPLSSITKSTCVLFSHHYLPQNSQMSLSYPSAYCCCIPSFLLYIN